MASTDSHALTTADSSARISAFAPASDGIVTAGLIVRAGESDEDLARHGVSQVVQHLLLTAVDPTCGTWTGFVDRHTTNFVVHGTPIEVTRFFDTLANAVVDPPYERIATVAKVLQSQPIATADPVLALSTQTRCGPQSYGLRGCRDFFYEQPDPDLIYQWLRHFYTTDNTALWSNSTALDELSMRLPVGPRRPAIAFEHGDDAFPAVASHRDAPVGITLADSASPELLVGLACLAEQLTDSLAANKLDHVPVRLSVEHLDGDTVLHGGISIEAAGESAAAIGELLHADFAQLCTDGPSEEIVARANTRLKAADLAIGTPDAYRSMQRARGHLFGVRMTAHDDALLELDITSGDEAAAALRNAANTAVWMLPDGLAWTHDSATPLRRWSTHAVHGAVMSPHQRGTESDRQQLVMAAEGISMLYGDEDHAATVSYDRLALMVVEPNGDRTIVGDDGFGFTIHADQWPWHSVIARHLDRYVDPELVLWRGQPRPARRPDHDAADTPVADRHCEQQVAALHANPPATNAAASNTGADISSVGTRGVVENAIADLADVTALIAESLRLSPT